MTIIYKNPTVIAEIGCNHKGNIDIAKDMIQIASNVKLCKIPKER